MNLAGRNKVLQGVMGGSPPSSDAFKTGPPIHRSISVRGGEGSVLTQDCFYSQTRELIVVNEPLLGLHCKTNGNRKTELSRCVTAGCYWLIAAAAVVRRQSLTCPFH